MAMSQSPGLPGAKGTGVFAGNLWGGSAIADTNCCLPAAVQLLAQWLSAERKSTINN